MFALLQEENVLAHQATGPHHHLHHHLHLSNMAHGSIITRVTLVNIIMNEEYNDCTRGPTCAETTCKRLAVFKTFKGNIKKIEKNIKGFSAKCETHVYYIKGVFMFNHLVARFVAQHLELMNFYDFAQRLKELST